jgi:putative oxidoreductase
MTLRFVKVLQLLIGLMFLGFFLMWAFHWKLPGVPPAADSLRRALLEAGYFFPVVAFVYLLVGLACITDRFVALAAIVLFPVTLSILLYHAFLVQSRVLLTAFVVVPNAFPAYVSRDAYRPLFRPRG